ncbi:hypothetical protein THICB3610002 [Thiomonas sp. CB3]|nr:hypothetical protein THICB3610002 [Thiomonas sp. CB3]
MAALNSSPVAIANWSESIILPTSSGMKTMPLLRKSHSGGVNGSAKWGAASVLSQRRQAPSSADSSAGDDMCIDVLSPYGKLGHEK